MIHVRPLETITSFLTIHTPRLMLPFFCLKKIYFQIEIIASSSNCSPCCFQSVWNTKNVCFLVCIFSTNLQRLHLFKNHRSDLKIIIFKMSEGKGKSTLVFICLDFNLFLRENLLSARTSSPSLDACAYTHIYRYMQAYHFPSWWRFQLDSSKPAYSLARLRPKSI